MEKTWDIIVWTAENYIDYVPSTWGNEAKTQYKYPRNCNSLRIRKLINSCAEPDKFIWLDAICNAGCVRNLNLAKEMCDKGQYPSNIELSEVEAAQTSNNRKRRNDNPNGSRSKCTSKPVMTDRKNEGTPQCHGFVRDMFVSPSSNEVSSITIVKKLHDIQFEILEIHKILKRVEVFMNAIVKRVEDSNLACSTNQLKYANMFPCTTRNELENINAEIRNEASNFNEVIVEKYARRKASKKRKMETQKYYPRKK
ncbi:hypothetical protein HUJ04_011010 [Dendroctonus ponderosae]|nr:hypothetical protein HUJ04_011010 [Dendroctonus ponderosae]